MPPVEARGGIAASPRDPGLAPDRRPDLAVAARRAGPIRRALAALIVAVLLLNAAWIARDTFPVGQEACNHLRLAQRLALELAEVDSAAQLWAFVQRNRRDGTRSTGAHLALAPVYLAVPAAPHRAQTLLLGTLTVALLGLATFALARAHTDAPTALLASALVLLAPGCWGPARAFVLDLPLTAGLTALAAVLVWRPPWHDARATFAVGLAAGALALVKAQAVYWAPWIVLPALVRSDTPTRARARALAVFTLGAAVGCAPYWIGDLTEVLELARDHMGQGGNPTASAGLDPTFYARTAVPYLGPLLPALLIGWLASVGQRPPRALVIWVVGGYVTFSLFSVKWGRYLLPALPPATILAAIGLRRLGRAGLAVAVPTLLLGLALCAATLAVAPPAALGLSPYCRVARRSTWDAAARTLRDRAGPAAVIGIEGTAEFSPDDYTRLALAVRRRYPRAEVVCRIPQFAEFAPRDLARYDARREAFDLLLVVHAYDETPAVRPHRQRLDLPPLDPGGEPANPARRWSAYTRTR